jgi:hypothetical protein
LLGPYAFQSCGIRSFAALGEVAVNKCAFRGCVQLRVASFGVVRFRALVFDGCEQLATISASRVARVSLKGFVGSSVVGFTGCRYSADCRKALEYITTPDVPAVPVVWAGDDGRLNLTSMALLTVQRGPLDVTPEQHRFLAEIDLSAFNHLPAGVRCARASD